MSNFMWEYYSSASTTIERVMEIRLSIDIPDPLVPFELIKATKFMSFYKHKLRCKQFMGHKFNVGGSKK